MHEELVGDTEDSPVSEKLKIIAKENPDMEKDQQLAIAYAYCRKEGIEALIKNAS